MIQPLKRWFFFKSWKAKVFFQFETIINVLVSFFPIHLNTYVMGLLPLEIVLLSQCGDRLESSSPSCNIIIMIVLLWVYGSCAEFIDALIDSTVNTERLPCVGSTLDLELITCHLFINREMHLIHHNTIKISRWNSEWIHGDLGNYYPDEMGPENIYEDGAT